IGAGAEGPEGDPDQRKRVQRQDGRERGTARLRGTRGGGTRPATARRGQDEEGGAERRKAQNQSARRPIQERGVMNAPQARGRAAARERQGRGVGGAQDGE